LPRGATCRVRVWASVTHCGLAGKRTGEIAVFYKLIRPTENVFQYSGSLAALACHKGLEEYSATQTCLTRSRCSRHSKTSCVGEPVKPNGSSSSVDKLHTWNVIAIVLYGRELMAKRRDESVDQRLDLGNIVPGPNQPWNALFRHDRRLPRLPSNSGMRDCKSAVPYRPVRRRRNGQSWHRPQNSLRDNHGLLFHGQGCGSTVDGATCDSGSGRFSPSSLPELPAP
jgi:hypothetical protein